LYTSWARIRELSRLFIPHSRKNNSMQRPNIMVLCLSVTLLCSVFSCTKEPVDYSKDINDLKALVTELQHRSDSLATALGNTNTNLSNLSKSVDSIKLKLTGIQTQIEALTLSLTTANANIAAINAQLILLNQQYASLLEQLNAILAQLNAAPTTLLDGLVAYYPFTGNAGDSSGNGNHGTVNGATLTVDRFGNASKAYSFDGNNNWISVTDNILLNPSTALSISLWEKSSAIQNNCGIIGKWNNFNGNSGYGQEQYVLYAGPNSTGVNFIILTANDTAISNERILVKYNDGNWHHFVGVYDGYKLSLYRDNILIDSAPLTGTINTFAQDLEIGRYSGGSGTGTNVNYFTGQIDDIRIYNRALNQSEITYLAGH